MPFSPHRFTCSAVAALLTLAPCVHTAAADIQGPKTAAATVTVKSAPQAQDPFVPVFGAAVNAALLDSARGGAGGIGTNADLRGTVSGNSATNVVTGANTIQASSFAGASGIPIVIQNSGANVLIQNATIINLQFQ